MKRILVTLLLSTCAWATATVTGNVSTLGVNTPSNVVVRFTLQNCRSLPRVIGTGLIVSTVQEISPLADGTISGTIYRNDEITCVSLNDSFYTVSIVLLQGGAQQVVKSMNMKVVTTTLNLNNAPTINNLSPSPFTPFNVITNPQTSQNIAQPTGTQTLFSGDSMIVGLQGSSDTEHGWELQDATGVKQWQFTQQPTSGGQPSYSFLLKSNFGGTIENYLRCVHDGASVGTGSCRWLGGLVDTDTVTRVDFHSAASTAPVQATASTLPTSCTAKTDLIIDQTGTGGQKLKVCNASGTGWDLVGDGGASSSVTSAFGRTGDVIAVAGDYAAITETLTNKTIDSVNNTIVTRSKMWYDSAGCVVSTAGVSLDTPSSGGATASCFQGTTNTQIAFGILSYPDASTTVSIGKYRLPADWSAGSSIDLLIKWYQDTSVSDPAQAVRWNFAVTCSDDGASLDKAWNTATAVTSATKAQYLNQTASVTGLSATGCNAGGIVQFKVERLGSDGADTFTNSARLVGAELTLVRSQ